MVASAAVEEQTPGRRLGSSAGRVAPVALVGAAVCAAVSWMLSSDYTSAWWLVPFVAAAVVLAVLRVGPTGGTAGRVVAAAIVTVACAVGAWSVWSPEPAMFVELRHQEAAADTAAASALAAVPRGTCRPAASLDVGPLDQWGPWNEVCAYGTADGSVAGVQFTRPAGSDAPGLVHAVAGGPLSSGCTRHLTGSWWAVRSPSSDPAKPCPRQYTFSPAG